MATSSPSPASPSSDQPRSSSQPTDIPSAPHQPEDPPLSTPLEMSSLHATTVIASSNPPDTQNSTQEPSSAISPAQETQDPSPERPVDVVDTAQSPADVKQEDAVPATIDSTAASTRPRQESSAIGPDTDGPIGPIDSSAGPAVVITLLLISGARHPYRIDEAYLKKRNIASANDAVVDPFSISIYTMKELIWRDWRAEWETRPSSPGSIRLIHFGKLLNDKAALSEYFKPDMPNVVHMNVRPHDFADDEDTAKAGPHQEHDEDDQQPGCCRCVIL